MKSLRTLAAVGLMLLLAGQACGQGLIIIDGPDSVLPPGPWPRRGCLELRHHQVQVEVHDQVATTTVEHVFYNPTSRQLEGHFVFPLVRGAQIDQVLMDVNGEQVEAELLDAGKARRIYEDIVRKMRDPALLEYCDDGLIRARVFPIEPNSEKRITITYTQLLPADAGLICYEYPLTDHRVEGRNVTTLEVKIELETTGRLTTLYSPTHELEISRQGKHRATVSLESSDTASGNVQLLFASHRKDDGPALTLMTYNDGREDGYFMLLASPPTPEEEDEHTQALPKTVLFVLDTSGSMAGEKLAQAKRALRYCLNNLNDNDTFQLIRFATDVEPLFDSPVNVTDKRRRQALAFVDDLKAVGGTAIDDALAEAIRQAKDSDAAGAAYIVFLTDGKPTVGQTDPDRIVKNVDKHSDAARIFCFGIGTDINTKLLDRITQTTRAASQYVLPEEDLEMKLSNFYAKIDQPVLADPVLKADGVKISQLMPRDLPDMFRGEQMVVFGRYHGDGDTTLTLTGQQGDNTIACEQNVDFARKSTRHDFIPRMWATRRVGFLLDEIRLHGESRELKDEVVTLARKFGIITPYTSYLIVEDEQRREVPAAQQTLSRISQDSALSETVAGEYSQMKSADTGRMGIAANRQNSLLSQAQVAAAPSMTIRPGAAQPQATIAVQTVRGRAFVLNGNQWIDSNVQQLKDPPVRQITFASDDYFALLHDHPETAQWLSVGRNVVFQLGDEVIEIVE